MEKIASFRIDHLRLKRGLFVSRVDRFSDAVITTFDIRMKEPNREPVIDVPTLHTLEHLGATFLRSHPVWAPRTVYFGPMGCRTGLYALFAGNWDSGSALRWSGRCFEWMAAFSGEVPAPLRRSAGTGGTRPGAGQWEARRSWRSCGTPLPRT
jgi:S-ribosylhomocysteine lyase